MRRYQILVYPRIDQLICTEAIVRPLESPDSYLWRKILVDFLDDILVFDNQFEGDDVTRGVNSFICSSASNERGFLGVVGVGFGDGTRCDEGFKEVSFYRFVVMRSIGH